MRFEAHLRCICSSSWNRFFPRMLSSSSAYAAHQGGLVLWYIALETLQGSIPGIGIPKRVKQEDILRDGLYLYNIYIYVSDGVICVSEKQRTSQEVYRPSRSDLWPFRIGLQ